MAGLYFHIPFCKRQCGYCDFYRTTRLALMPTVVEQMHKELMVRHAELSDRQLRTIYFGGGTPSLMDAATLQSLIDRAREVLDTSALEEVTVEVNPDDVTPEYVAALRATDVNRISIGVQSLDDAALQLMGRRHDAAQAIAAVRLLQDAGYDNISVDVIFGVPGFGDASLRHTLEGVVALDVQHISAYHLTVEPDTRFGRLVAQGSMSLIAEERSEAEFLEVHRTLVAAGFDHYKVSNYALEGHRSRHNSSYWLGSEYLGIGPGAHSFMRGVRSWYDGRIEEYRVPLSYNVEHLTLRDEYNEYVMTSLRRAEGLSMGVVEHRFGLAARRRVETLVEPLLAAGVVVARGDELAVPAEKFLVSDSVIEQLFDV